MATRAESSFAAASCASKLVNDPIEPFPHNTIRIFDYREQQRHSNAFIRIGAVDAKWHTFPIDQRADI